MGINTAFDFSQMSRSWVRKHMTVVGERTWRELHGESCIELEMIPPDKKQICTSRAFGETVTDLEELKEAVAYYASISTEKLRRQKSCAVSIMVTIQTNNFNTNEPQYSPAIVIPLPVPTASTIEITHYALQALYKIYRKGYKYKRAGVIITEIVPDNAIQTNLFDKVDREKHKRIMKVVDNLNRGFTDNVLYLAVQGHKHKWKLRREFLSPQYTTKLSDVISINCNF